MDTGKKEKMSRAIPLGWPGLIETFNYFLWLVPLVSDRSVWHNGKHFSEHFCKYSVLVVSTNVCLPFEAEEDKIAGNYETTLSSVIRVKEIRKDTPNQKWLVHKF